MVPKLLECYIQISERPPAVEVLIMQSKGCPRINFYCKPPAKALTTETPTKKISTAYHLIFLCATLHSMC